MTAPTITSEAVEAAAQALYGQSHFAEALPWSDVSSAGKFQYREIALAVLLPTAKHIAASALRDAGDAWVGDQTLTDAFEFLRDRAETIEES